MTIIGSSRNSEYARYSELVFPRFAIQLKIFQALFFATENSQILFEAIEEYMYHKHTKSIDAH
ncbi:hypothetical protein CLU79DRAFT_742478 [Phycomyces nitens]|nr:hypothetical protein CLU79DRAFT_742478 [Phycomyces nitens]